MEIESTPDSGVEIKKAVVAPLLAPCLRSDTAAGNTPQDHNGMGIPRKAALNTDENRPRPKCRTTEFGLRNTRSRPLISNPNKIYTDASSNRYQDAMKTSITKFIILLFPFQSHICNPHSSLFIYMFQTNIKHGRDMLIIQRIIYDLTFTTFFNQG